MSASLGRRLVTDFHDRDKAGGDAGAVRRVEEPACCLSQRVRQSRVGVGNRDAAQRARPGHLGARLDILAVRHRAGQPGADQPYRLEGDHAGEWRGDGIDVGLDGMGQDIDTRQCREPRRTGIRQLGIDQAARGMRYSLTIVLFSRSFSSPNTA